MVCSCPHNKVYGIHLLNHAEGRKDAFNPLTIFFPKDKLQNLHVIYDFGCDLWKYSIYREPLLFAKWYAKYSFIFPVTFIPFPCLFFSCQYLIFSCILYIYICSVMSVDEFHLFGHRFCDVFSSREQKSLNFSTSFMESVNSSAKKIRNSIAYCTVGLAIDILQLYITLNNHAGN